MDGYIICGGDWMLDWRWISFIWIMWEGGKWGDVGGSGMEREGTGRLLDFECDSLASWERGKKKEDKA